MLFRGNLGYQVGFRDTSKLSVMKYSPWRSKDGTPLPMAPRDLLIALVAIACLFFYGGWLEWTEPSSPPFTGRMAWFYLVAFAILGQRGPAYISWAGGVALLGLALANWLKLRATR
jgi:hypothetical protein